MLKHLVAIDVSQYKGETSSKQVIQMDIDLSLVKNMHVVHNP